MAKVVIAHETRGGYAMNAIRGGRICVAVEAEVSYLFNDSVQLGYSRPMEKFDSMREPLTINRPANLTADQWLAMFDMDDFDTCSVYLEIVPAISIAGDGLVHVELAVKGVFIDDHHLQVTG